MGKALGDRGREDVGYFTGAQLTFLVARERSLLGRQKEAAF
jgi:hypothetical protein